MNWTSAEQVVRELNLSANPRDYDAIKRELRVGLASIHPDKNGGTFSNTADETRYNAISSAYEYIGRSADDSTALIPVTQLPAIIKAVRDAQVAPRQAQISTLRTECRSESRVATHDRYLLPKVGSGTFAAVCGALFTFSGSLVDHPILGAMAKTAGFQYGLLTASAYAGLFFLLTWSRERREEARVEWLMSDEGRRHIFDNLLRKTRDPMRVSKSGHFTAREVVDVIMEDSGYRMGSPAVLVAAVLLSRGRITTSVAEKIADVHLLELEQRGAIRKLEDPSIDVVYEFDAQVRHSLEKSG